MQKATTTKHPAKYSDQFLPIFAELLAGRERVLDPFGGTGKIGAIKGYGFGGVVFANEIEREWLEPNLHNCDVCTFEDAEILAYPPEFFDAVCTSPTYGNRMADHHNAKDGSRRNTYTHCLGKQLQSGNTGKMQWGEEYKEKHRRIYAHIVELLKPNGIFILNISNHIRAGKEIDVTQFHIDALQECGLTVESIRTVGVQRLKYGANAEKRVPHESIIVLKK